MTKLFTEQEVSAITGRKLPTLQKDRLKGCGIPYLKIGRQVRYSEKDVAAFMESCRIAVKPLRHSN